MIQFGLCFGEIVLVYKEANTASYKEYTQDKKPIPQALGNAIQLVEVY